jgi:hypothetical protein
VGIAIQRLTLLSTSGSTATVTGAAVRLNPLKIGATNFIGRLGSVDNGTTVVDGKIQHGPTSSGPWTDLASFTTATGSTGSTPKEVHIPAATTSIFQFLRGVATISGASPNADITLELYHD